MELTELILSKVTTIGAVIVGAVTSLKAWREYVGGDVEKQKSQDNAEVEKLRLNYELEKAKLDNEVAIAKENSAGVEAIKQLRQVDREFREKIEKLEREISEGFKMAEKDRDQLFKNLEDMKREHTEFINKSLEYFMGRKQ